MLALVIFDGLGGRWRWSRNGRLGMASMIICGFILVNFGKESLEGQIESYKHGKDASEDN